MIHFIVPSTIGLGLGSFLGKHLAQQGITAENALDKHQTTARVIFALMVAIITPFIILEHYNLGDHLPRAFPQRIFISLYSQAFCEVIMGNPLSGIQIKTFQQFKDYWFGEVIFVS